MRFLKSLARHRLVQDIIVLFGVQVLAYVLPLITLPYLAQVLGPATFGLLALGMAMAQYFVVVSEYGFAVTGTRRVATVQGNMEQVSRVYSTIMACKLLLMAVGFVVLCALLLSVQTFRAHATLYLVSFLIVAGWGLSPNWLFQGLQRIKFVAWSDYGAKILSVGLIFLLVRNSGDYLLAAAVQCGAFLLSAAIGLAIMFSLVGVKIVRPAWSDMREVMIEGWPVFLSMASMTVVTSSNTMILGVTAPPDQVGYLNAASRLIIAARALANPIANAVYPHMSRLVAQSREEALRFLRRQLFWTSIPFALVSLGMLVFSPLLVRMLYGAQYAETAVLLRIMSLIPFVHAISMCFGTYYMLAFGYEKAWARVIRRMMVLNFLSIFLLMTIMRPVRAVALTTILMDIFSAVSCCLFYLRNERAPRAAEPPSIASAAR